jgi:hypothetical protein
MAAHSTHQDSAEDTWVYAPRAPDGWGQAILWYISALFACLFVALINKGALYYFDTAGYLEQGQSTLNSIGLFEAEMEADGTAAGGGDAALPDGVVVGSRSAIYSTIMTALRFTTGINGLVLAQVAALMLSIWIVARVAARQFLHGRSVAATTAIPILAASFGSLPFYTAYLMPDIFAPILILVASTFAIFSRDMTFLEIVLALGLGLVAAVTHPSHLIIAVLLLPVVAIASVAMARSRWWLAPLLMGLIVLGGFAERAIFASAVKSVKSSEVVYQPFLTARTIADGPGLAVLQDRCPDAEIPTCVLYEALQKSDDPWRLTASHIMFETSPSLGSFKFLSLEDQARVAHDQIPFFLTVLRERPIALTLSFLQNTLDQANLFSIQYTIPTTQTLINVHKITDIAPSSFEGIRLLDQRTQLSWLTMVHGALYAVSALLVVVIVVLPQKAPPLAFRAFAMVIFVGILINAFVCGGVSQPSDRYGARVAFLLPIATSFILLFYSGVRVPGTRKPD